MEVINKLQAEKLSSLVMVNLQRLPYMYTYIYIYIQLEIFTRKIIAVVYTIVYVFVYIYKTVIIRRDKIFSILFSLNFSTSTILLAQCTPNYARCSSRASFVTER